MRCKQRRLGDSIYEYNSNWPTSSCQYNGFKLAINEIKIMFHTTDHFELVSYKLWYLTIPKLAMI
jgi:hypothetical protein